MTQDTLEKRAQFIDTSVKIRESFHFAHPAEQILAVEKYCTAAYGSNLWDLGSPETKMFVNAWRTGHKLAWEVPRSCHTYLVQEVLAPHVVNLNVSLLLKFVGFFRSLLASPSSEVVVVALLAARDLRSNLGKNLALVRETSGLDPWVAGPAQLRAALERAEVREVPKADFWRAGLLRRLLSEQLLAKYAANVEQEKRLEGLISSLVQN